MVDFRRAAAGAAAVLTVVAAGLLTAAGARPVAPPPSLLLDGVAVLVRDGTPVVAAVPPGSAMAYAGSSRVPAADTRLAARGVAAAQSAWLEYGTVPGRGGPWEDMATGALLDIHTLTGATFTSGRVSQPGATVAGWIPLWRLVWPRDAAHVAVALARTGHADDAAAVLAFLQSQQRPDGSFAARSLPTGVAVGDGRRDQLDAVGYVLWATRHVLAEAPDASDQFAPLVERATAHLMAATADGLPAPSSDSWEVAEERLTIGTAAAALMGLDSAAALSGDAAVAARRDLLRDEILRTFGPGGFQRYANPSGSLVSASRQGADANVALLLPPFQSEPVPGAFDAWTRSVRLLREPAGGLSPGAGWRNDGVSWTPQTTLYAWVAAENGAEHLAAELLDWTDAHRTSSGAIPEKVTAEGQPRSVAPLTWSAANVVLAVQALER
ncbi:MAG: glycoside hydrolase family 15 [Actinobacteria bacterium]|nr:glycoside hydrolase family 15 [Actinomycetota bacterium]